MHPKELDIATIVVHDYLPMIEGILRSILLILC
jgi:hypothetical protein